MSVRSCESEHHIESLNGRFNRRDDGRSEIWVLDHGQGKAWWSISTHDIMMRGEMLFCQAHAILRHMYNLPLGVR